MNFYEKEPVSLYLSDLEILEKLSTKQQQIILCKHPFLGIVLIINGEVQHIEKYQCPYHELLVHLPASFIQNPRKALIIGGGSLFAAYEILKYPSIESVILCDHDAKVLEIMKKYYIHARCVMSDPRFQFIESDGLEFIKHCNDKYDLIINDCFNLLNISVEKHFPIYLKLKQLLTPSGLCSDIIYRHIFDGEITNDSIKEIKKYSDIVLSLVTIPEYPGILHIETIWGNNINLSQTCKHVINEYQKAIIKGESNPFDFFSPDNLPFYLYIPPYIKNKITI